jgi:hypothetical protein
MFESISWQDFLTTISLIVGGYYAITTLLLYGAEITSIFNQKKLKSIEPAVSEDQNASNESKDLMGKVKYETGVNVPHEIIVESNELNVQHTHADEEPILLIDPREAMLAGFGSGLQEEIATLVTEFSTSNEGEIILVFKSLLSVYPQLVRTPYKDSISLLIRDSLKANSAFHPELNEINSWWPEVRVNTTDIQ